MPTQNIGQVSAFFSGATPPTNTNLIWLDTSVSPALHKFYDSTISAWVSSSSDVSSIFGRTGVISAVSTDYNSFYLRHDTAAQGLNGTQQANAITNLGITATATELNYVDGVTSNIQTQIDNVGSTTINGTTDNGVVTYINSSAEFQVESGLTFDGTDLEVTGAVKASEFNSPSGSPIIMDAPSGENYRFRLNGSDAATLSNNGFTVGVAANNIISVNNLTSATVDTDLTLSGNGSGNVVVNDDLEVTGTLSKGSGTFKIDHPLDSNKWLYHSFVESPQADNIYRGVVELVNGAAQIEIDTTHNMTVGTFEALNGNVQVFLQNNDGWDLVKGSVTNGVLTVTSNNPLSSDTIDWLVVGERKDETVKNWNLTNKGELIPEWNKG